MKLGGMQLGLFDWLRPQQAQPPVQNTAEAPPNTQSAANSAPSETSPSIPSQTNYLPVHPQSNRWLEHEGRKFHYHLKRGSRRTIGLQVGSDGLVVSAPRWALVGDIARVVAERAAWAVEKLREARERDEAHMRQKIVWANGVCLPYLGRQIKVVLDPQTRAEGLSHPELVGEMPTLKLRLMPDANEVQIREKVQAWLAKQAKELFAQRLDHYAPRLAVAWKRLRLSQARTRWGSANSQGTICLNWRLIHHALPVIDYVIVHELSHLRVMNHSTAFWDTVASVMPDYKQSMQVLKKETLPPW
jgi:predicted metal-dependent hydrolase